MRTHKSYGEEKGLIRILGQRAQTVNSMSGNPSIGIGFIEYVRTFPGCSTRQAADRFAELICEERLFPGQLTMIALRYQILDHFVL